MNLSPSSYNFLSANLSNVTELVFLGSGGGVNSDWLIDSLTYTSTQFYTLIVNASPADGGTATGGGSFASDSSQTVTATANIGYTFANWTENGIVVSTSASYSFTLTGNETLTANFAPFQITSITPTNAIDLLITWNTTGTNNIVQVTAGADASGSFSTNGFIDVTNLVVTTTTTNFWDMGAATSNPSRYYRIRSPE